MDIGNRFRGCLLGLASGDAVGTTVEFKTRGSFDPLKDMLGGGPFKLNRGQWTDDTSMALCMAASFVERQRYDAHDIMKRFCLWHDQGYMSSTGSCFDIGNATFHALERFKHTGDPYSGSAHPESAGNGSIMRLAPVPMFFYPDSEAAITMSADSSRLTHAADECIDACRLFGALLFQALSGADKETILAGHKTTDIGSPRIRSIAEGGYLKKGQSEIKGSGYVVESLEAALWCFARTNTFEDAVLCAANLGDDADTTAAICGQVAGAFYGESGIPKRWLEWLTMADEIRSLADQLAIRGRHD